MPSAPLARMLPPAALPPGAQTEASVRHPDPAYLSASLDQLVTEIIGSFDDETRRILNYASIFGESVPLSMLTGFSGDRETLPWKGACRSN